MATVLYARATQTHFAATPSLGYTDLLTVAGTTEHPVGLHTTTVEGERYFVYPTKTAALTLWSERIVETSTALSGDVTFQVNAKQTLVGDDPELRLRARLWKVTAGGGAVETLVTEADATASLTGSYVLYTITGTILTPVTVVENERLILRVSVVPFTGDFSSNPAATMRYGESGGANPTTVTLTETLTFKPNGEEMFLRTTATIGIGAFLDLVATRGASAATTSVVNTTEGGTEIPFDLAWISPRLQAGWNSAHLQGGGVPIKSAITIPTGAYLVESSTAANCGGRVKAFRRQPDGTETLVCIINTGELPTTLTNDTWTASPIRQEFAEDDRLVVRAYVKNDVGSMASGHTCTLSYDSNVDTGNLRLVLYGLPEFKAEGDPLGTNRVTNALMTSGIGN